MTDLTSAPSFADREPSPSGWLTYIAEASDLLAGTLDEDQVTALIAQLLVPRLALWCAIYNGGRLSLVWHADEDQAEELRDRLEESGPPALNAVGSVPWHVGDGHTVQTYVFPMAARGRRTGAIVISGGRLSRGAVELAEELSRRAALALDNARLYAAQTAMSQALQRSLLPSGTPDIPGIEVAVVYEPAGEGTEVGGDFYDVFEVPGESRRWRFAVGDVCGTGPEAAAVTGLARHALRILGAEGMPLPGVIERLNRLILEEGARGRLLTLLHGELQPGDDTVRLDLVSAGHPSPLLLSQDGTVREIATPQPLLGAFDEAGYGTDALDLHRGDVLLCFTDGVTERRGGRPAWLSGYGDEDDSPGVFGSGKDGDNGRGQELRMLGDDGGLELLLAGCTGLSAGAVAARIQQAVREFAVQPSDDDVAIVVLRIR